MSDDDLRTHKNRPRPVSAHVEYRGERTAFGEPMLRLVVGDEWIGFTSRGALEFATTLQLAALELEARTNPGTGSI